MKIDFNKALSFYFTGSTNLNSAWKTDFNHCPYSKDELAELEIDWETSKKGFQFQNETLSLHADWETFPGYVRNAGLGMFDSLFSGIGAGFASKTNFSSGVVLAALATLTSLISTIQKIPFLSTNFSLFDYGGRLLRSTLHFFDSTFSTIGEKGACYEAPTLIAGLASLFSLNRVLNNKENRSLEIPITTIGGTLGRTAIHHMESMLASKASYLACKHESLSAFFASAVTTLGLLSPKEIKDKILPWQTTEGMISQAGFHFLDSVFSTTGGSFAKHIANPLNFLLAGAGFAASLPILSSNKKIWDYKVPFPKVEGKLVRSLFHGIEALIFNAGSRVGNSVFGVLLSIGFGALTYFATLSKGTKSLFKNFKIPMNTVGGLVQRLPFDFAYSAISASGAKLSKLIPAPLLVLFGPMVSFRLGEMFKNEGAKYDEFKGLMIRNAVHLWESILAGGAYRIGRILTGTLNKGTSSGSVLADGRWLTDEGRIVPTMAIGKQMHGESSGNILHTLLSGLGGIGAGVLINNLMLHSKVNTLKGIAKTFDQFIWQKLSRVKSELSVRAKRAVQIKEVI